MISKLADPAETGTGGRLKRENRDMLDQCGKPIATRGLDGRSNSPTFLHVSALGPKHYA